MACGDPSIPLAVTVTVPMRVLPVAFVSAVIVKLPGVVLPFCVTLSHVSLGVTLHENELEFPQLVTLMDWLVPPVSGAVQLVSDTHRYGPTVG